MKSESSKSKEVECFEPPAPSHKKHPKSKPKTFIFPNVGHNEPDEDTKVSLE